jgi:cytochrome c peroxidase
VNRFSSKFDLSFGGRGHGRLSKLERRGFALFRGKGKCNQCHDSKGRMAAFTNFGYDNIGVPSNPESPAVADDPDYLDEGLGGFLRSRGEQPEVYEPEIGKMKTPTLRNVDRRPTEDSVKAYTHNGYFKSLESLVNFYNTRDVKQTCPGSYTEAQALAADCWPEPEVSATVNTVEMGNLGLTKAEEHAIVAFLKTLSDGYQP